MPQRHFSIAAHPRELKRVRDAVDELSQPLFGKNAHLVALAVDEALANVILHGVPKSNIDIQLDVHDGRIEARIVDDGQPHDPNAAAAVTPAERTVKRQRGGMGLGIVRTVMDEILYARLSNDRNELRLIKYAAKAISAGANRMEP